MSTRGCVAVKKRDGWEGVYNHFDSYPTNLGKKLWEELRDTDLTKFAESILSFTDWREYLNGGTCKYCGRKGLGQPHSISGKIMGFDSPVTGNPDPEIQESLDRTGYPDPEANHHEHKLDGDREAEDTHITSDYPDPLFMEWVYIVDPNERTLEILTSRGTNQFDGNVEAGDPPEPLEDGYWDYGNYKYRHVRIALVNLDGPEPDWQLIHDLDRAVAVPDDSSKAEKVSERLTFGSESRDCPVCGGPVPEAKVHPELEDRTVGHARCVRRALKRLGAEVEDCIRFPQDI